MARTSWRCCLAERFDLFLAAAVDDGVIPANPAEKLGRHLRLVMPKAVRQEEIKAMTREQRQLFLAHRRQRDTGLLSAVCDPGGDRDAVGGGVALQWDDVNLEGREIRVARALSRGQVETPKAGHGRTVDISQTLAQMLRQLEQRRVVQMAELEWPYDAVLGLLYASRDAHG